MHPPVLRGAAASGGGHPPVPVPRGILRSRLRTTDRRPAAPAAPAHPLAGARRRNLRCRRRGAHRVSIHRPFTRDQCTTVVNGMLAFVLMLVVLQLWLLTATMNAYLGGDEAVIWPAAAASLTWLLLNVGLLRYLYQMHRTRSCARPRTAR